MSRTPRRRRERAGRVASDHAAQFPEYAGWRLVPVPLAEGLLQSARPAGFLVLGAVALVLLIACANLASLMLARATGRQREFAVRVAMGAGRGRLARQLLTETALLALIGGLVGFALAAVAIRASNALLPAQLTAFGLAAGISPRVAAWCVLSTSVAVLLVGVLPAFQIGRADPNESLKHDARMTSSSRGAARARHVLVVAEIALAVVLALGAGLLVRTFANLQRVDSGVDANGVLTMRLTLPSEKYRTAESITVFFEELVRRVEGLPGISRAGVTSQFPPMEFQRSPFTLEGAAPPEGSTLPSAYLTNVSRGYFDALGIRLRAGRAFDDRDIAGAPRVIVVNEAFAARYLGGASPLGRRIRPGDRADRAQPVEVIGVVANTSNADAAAPPAPEMFLPLAQSRNNQLFLVAKAAGDPMAILPSIRQALVSIDPDQPVYAIQTMREAFESSIVTERIASILMMIFAVVALLLAGIGIYGVTAYAVRARTQEIGIRIAIGAERSTVVWMIVRQVLGMVAVGLALGIAAVTALGPVLGSVLFGVSPIDPMTVAATAAALGAVAVSAAWRPAANASRVDPVVALRYE